MKNLVLAIVATLALLIVGASTKAQTCSAGFSNLSDLTIFSGTAVVPSSITLLGGGTGISSSAWWDYAAASQGSSTSGTVSIVARLRSLSTGQTTPASGVIVGGPGGAFGYDVARVAVVYSVDPTNGPQIVLGALMTDGFGNAFWNVIATQSVTNVSTTPLYLQIVLSSKTYTASYSTDGTNYTTLGSTSYSASDSSVSVGLYVQSGSDTQTTTTLFDNISVNGASPAFQWGTAGNGPHGYITPVFQGGNLFIAEAVSGYLVPSNCSSGQQFDVNNFLFLLQGTTQLFHSNSQPIHHFNSCTSACTFSGNNPLNPPSAYGPIALTSGVAYSLKSQVVSNPPGNNTITKILAVNP